MPVRDSAGRPVGTGLNVKLNTGMMGVVPAWKLTELLMRDDLVAARKTVEDKYVSQLAGQDVQGSTHYC